MDEGTPIPLVKILGEVERAPAPHNYWREDVFVYCEIVNIGTAPTTAADQVWGSLLLGNTIINQQHENLDSPAIEPNGGTRRFMFKFDGHFMAVADDWSMSVSVTNSWGEISDDGRTPQFAVTSRESDAP